MRRRYLVLAMAGTLLASLPDPVRAQTPAASRQVPAATDARAPLDRPVKLALRRAALREALDQIARQASLPLSYSPEMLPPGKRVTLAYSEIPAGDALREVLCGTGLRLSISPTGQIAVLREPPHDSDEFPD